IGGTIGAGSVGFGTGDEEGAGAGTVGVGPATTVGGAGTDVGAAVLAGSVVGLGVDGIATAGGVAGGPLTPTVPLPPPDRASAAAWSAAAGSAAAWSAAAWSAAAWRPVQAGARPRALRDAPRRLLGVCGRRWGWPGPTRASARASDRRWRPAVRSFLVGSCRP